MSFWESVGFVVTCLVVAITLVVITARPWKENDENDTKRILRVYKRWFVGTAVIFVIVLAAMVYIVANDYIIP